jgi:hypothetical protein
MTARRVLLALLAVLCLTWLWFDEGTVGAVTPDTAVSTTTTTAVG